MHAGEALRQMVPLSRGGDRRLRVHVDAPHNALAVDDDAFAWIEHAAPVAVTVVGQQTGWLRPLLRGRSGRQGDVHRSVQVRAAAGAWFQRGSL